MNGTNSFRDALKKVFIINLIFVIIVAGMIAYVKYFCEISSGKIMIAFLICLFLWLAIEDRYKRKNWQFDYLNYSASCVYAHRIAALIYFILGIISIYFEDNNILISNLTFLLSIVSLFGIFMFGHYRQYKLGLSLEIDKFDSKEEFEKYHPNAIKKYKD